MILPTKSVAPDRALLSVGAEILRDLDEPKTVSRLWAELRKQDAEALELSFDWFVLALDLLYLLGVVEYVAGRLHRTTSNTVEPTA